MRIAGYNFLVFGFLWLTLWCAPSVGPLTHSIAVENLQKYDEDRPYSRSEVGDVIRNVLTEYQENARGIVLPATLMLIGGYLLGRAGARDTNEANDKPSA
jgi:hypothetical protein